ALEHAHPDKPSYKSDLAKTYRHLGIAQAFDGRPDEATTSFQQAIDLGEALVDKHPNDSQVSEYRKDLAWAYNNFANQQGGLHTPTQALKYYKKAVSIWGKGDNSAEFLNGLAQGYSNLGLAQEHTGLTFAALESVQKAVDVQKKLADAHRDVTDY